MKQCFNIKLETGVLIIELLDTVKYINLSMYYWLHAFFETVRVSLSPECIMVPTLLCTNLQQRTDPLSSFPWK